MKSVLRSRTAPDWTADLTVDDEVYIEDGIRRGKRRLRIDIEFEQVRRGPRPIFQYEAKRLRSTASLRAYVGRDGLGCFLDGRYAKDQDTAGMLGHVQSGTVEQRAAQLVSKLDTHLGTLATGRWQPRSCVPRKEKLPSIDAAFIPVWPMLAWMVGFRGGFSRRAGNMQIEEFVIGILGKLEHRLEASDSADDPARD